MIEQGRPARFDFTLVVAQGFDSSGAGVRGGVGTGTGATADAAPPGTIGAVSAGAVADGSGTSHEWSSPPTFGSAVFVSAVTACRLFWMSAPVSAAAARRSATGSI